jgi:AcrR family transcriptional regulator
MDAVAERARASKATIYRHWSGKGQLVAAAVRSRTDEVGPEVPDTGSLRGDVLVMLRAMAAGVESQDASVLVGVLRAMQDTPDVAASVRSHILEHKLAVARSILDRAAARGEIGGAADSAVVVELAAGLIFFRCIVLGQPLDDAFLEHVADEVLLPLLTRR